MLLWLSWPPAGWAVEYFQEIRPVLAVHCYKCHAGEERKGGLQLDQSAEARAGGRSGRPAIAPGWPEASELLRRISSSDPDEQMPPKGGRLPPQEIERIRQWIAAGAVWPERDDYWAFRPPQAAPLPPVREVEPVRNAIDRFLQSRLEGEGIVPLGEADRRTLLRRAYGDLLGVPPTREEADRFLQDDSPAAFENLVDRLLADPRYGERWGRHWLDLVRYGESDGYEDDKVRPHAWRYRDYVIQSLNADKRYDRFVREQIAGDELWPEQPEALIATGFARLGSWDGMSKEPEKQRQDFLTDATDAAGAVFLGVTLGCARCHDHKYDRITQRDYYAMQAHFAGVRRETGDLPPDFAEPPFVPARFRQEEAELDRLRQQKRDLTYEEQEVSVREEAGGGDKTEQEKLKRQLEDEHSKRRAKIEAAIKEAEARARLFAPKREGVLAPEGAPPETRILGGGELSRPGEVVPPGLIEAMAQAKNLPAGPEMPAASEERGRRSRLAAWLSAPDHPLTARVMVNRLWQHHFGEGLVATASDFGRNGRAPVHRELLDWLAVEFVRQGWSWKAMHRLMMNSAAYRRASHWSEAAFARDPANTLLWRMNRRRLEAESIRDTILAVSGKWNGVMGGPGVYAPLPAGVNVEFPNNDKELSWGQAEPGDEGRRSIYLFQRRSLTFPMLDVFDAAPMNQSCAARPHTTVAPQALALFNGEFSRRAAERFAARLRREAGPAVGARIDQAFQIALIRNPTEGERLAAERFLLEQTAARSGRSEAAWADFCHVLLNTSELIYLD